ncbi:hypothetical protein FB005_1602 [Sinorhizobium medicae]|nr:hypothetical protein FB006_1129 [Sinorhizobium medicae]TWA21442.1 hypothetical protein FB007_1667 [Sinorhizobium medicae]TWA32697.1 hypothetical protein FB005_1602 [Sinorhizobium medicae]
MIVQNNRFPVEDGCHDGKAPRVIGDRRKAIGPIVAAARENPHPARLDVHGQLVPVPLYLIGPVGAGGRLVQGSTRACIGSSGATSRDFFEDALAISPLTHRPAKSRIDSFGLENI